MRKTGLFDISNQQSQLFQCSNYCIRSCFTISIHIITPIFDRASLLALVGEIGRIHVDDGILGYVHRLLLATRTADAVELGVGTRAGLHLVLAARAWALLAGRDFVTPDDVRSLAVPVCAHRLVLHADAQIDGLTPQSVLEELARRVEVPR